MKEWTLMFYFASDNPLAPEIISQLKALKNAGYHPDVNVIAYFDPQVFGPQAHIFDVNAFDKLGEKVPKIGFMPDDPYVRALLYDKLWGDEKNRNGKSIRDLMQELIDKPGVIYDLPKHPSPSKSKARSLKGSAHFRNGNRVGESKSDSGPTESLRTFLRFCASTYKAKHYMLFILGHGLVVGDDVFLFDEHAATHSVTLKELGEVLKDFKTKIRKIPGAQFELVGFHSCSMSSLEVAFELQGTAKYMLASQGPAFVSRWPYRQIVMRVFNDVNGRQHKTKKDVKIIITRIFDYVYYNSIDFMLAGYSFDICLCDLSRSGMAVLKKPLKDLSNTLIKSLALKNEVLTGCILLAHWKSKSYFNENYTDLFDFCVCLSDYCDGFKNAVNNPEPYKNLQAASAKVCAALSGLLVIPPQSAGIESQHSHGFSIFFPWTRPISDRPIMDEYKDYKFKVTDWLKFLNQYWGPEEFKKSVEGSTMRDSPKGEAIRKSLSASPEPVSHENRVPTAREKKKINLVEDMVNLLFNPEGPLNLSGALSGDPPTKPNPQSSMGDGCTCGSIKNYRRDTRARDERSSKANPAIQARQVAQQKI